MTEKGRREREDFSPRAIRALQNAVSCGNINLNDVLQWDEDMRKKEILAQHKFPITYGKSDNRWHTYVPDEGRPNKRKSVAKRNRDDLETYLVNFYREREGGQTKADGNAGIVLPRLAAAQEPANHAKRLYQTD